MPERVAALSCTELGLPLDSTSDAVEPALSVAAAAQPPMDAQAFAQLFASEAPRVWGMLRRMGVPPADLEDVCQEVFLVVHRRWAEYRGESSVRTWILGIALRKALGHRRRRGLRENVSLSQIPDPEVRPAQPQLLEQKQLGRQLQAALDTLTEVKREVFVLYELEELPMRDVARLLELPINTCYSRLYAARSELAIVLRQLGREGGRR